MKLAIVFGVLLSVALVMGDVSDIESGDPPQAHATVDYYDNWNASNPCPPVAAREKACTTGSCGANLLVTKYAIPIDCKLLEVSNGGKVTPTAWHTEVFSEVSDEPDEVASGYVVNGITGSNTTLSQKVNAAQIDDPGFCCALCQQWDGTTGDYADLPKCTFYQHFPLYGRGTGTCFMYTGTNRPVCRSKVLDDNSISIVGAACSNPELNHDPHLVGAHGTPYDFSGLPDQSFALISDEHLEVNMRLTGYLDERTESATLLKDGKAVRTWIRELGIMWVDYMGKQHRLSMLARPGKISKRGPGLLRSAFLDGKAVSRLQAGESFVGAGGLVLKMIAVTTEGPYEVDQYNLVIDGVLDLDLRLRVAHKLLQTEGESRCHFSLGVNSITPTENIHGVLGQTYRKDHAQRAEEFSLIAAKLHHNIQADGPEGLGFLDGVAADYKTSGVLTADSKFNVYNPAVVRAT
eukprot:TRINITY_DN44_c0_g1_i1.p1 TRINITY_DN44_c0_g1~~TRINITY_DN44_c0_g1_i1.p1  ORF type:complete len:463 (-),score=59.13 TRINITY_DN44_c0_g1_i1:854-2242(-)